MLKDYAPHQTELEMVTLEDLVPAEHLVRKIEAAIDFEFIRDKVRHLYCPNNGRPAIDPVMLFKVILLGYLFGIRSERQLMREIQVNTAYRWFLRLRLTDPVSDASTISQNRRRRFSGSSVYQDIFDAIVVQAMNRGLIDGHALYTDSTHLKANANKNKFQAIQVQQSIADYLAELDKAIVRSVPNVASSRSNAMTTHPTKNPAPAPSNNRPLTLTVATWCATRNPKASSTSITAPWMASMSLSWIPTPQRTMWPTAVPTSRVLIA